MPRKYLYAVRVWYRPIDYKNPFDNFKFSSRSKAIRFIKIVKDNSNHKPILIKYL